MPFSAGCRVALADDIPVLVLYPAEEPEVPTPLGPFEISAAPDSPVAAGLFPLVVISHGTGSWHLLHRNLARHLARNGFIVAVPEHPRNNRNNNDLAGTAENMTNRPRHIRSVIDWAMSDRATGPHIKSDTVAIIGHSMGGYTALACAGGRPIAFPHETPDMQVHQIDVTPDPRIKALVLLAPATPWFKTHGALADVTAPILMLTAELDEHTHQFHAGVVERGLPEETLLEHRVVPGAGHFSFLSPYPQAMIKPDFPPSQDPAGFNRPRFHDEMNGEVLAFLRRVLECDSVGPVRMFPFRRLA